MWLVLTTALGPSNPVPSLSNLSTADTVYQHYGSHSLRCKHSASGAQRPQHRKKRKAELGRQSSTTNLDAKRIHAIRTRGGNAQYLAFHLVRGNFAWTSENVAIKTRLIRVVYNASNNELVRTNTLVKSAIIQIDATPFRQWYESHYAQPVSKELAAKAAAAAAADEAGKTEPMKKSRHVERKFEARKQDAKIDPLLETQFGAGRLYAAISSRPGEVGRADGYILEGKELEFYIGKLRAGKHE